MNINIHEAVFDKVSVDPCGKLFRWKGRLFRAINYARVAEVKNIFSCGMIDELVSQRLFPESAVTDFTLEGYGLVVEHDLIDPVTYPFEWTFSMLKDAALTVLNTNRVARTYGYQTKDCHPYNVCFDGTTPLFVDLGSFISTSGSKNWVAYEEFITSYWYPLYLWHHGNSYFARKMLFSLSMTESVTHSSMLLYRFPLTRFLKSSLLQRIAGLYSRLVRDRSVDFARVMRSIERCSRKECSSAWKKYHDEYYDEKGIPVLNARFGRVMELLTRYNIKSIVELGGNRGVFSQLVACNSKVEKIICTDYDEEAVDLMYLEFKQRNIDVTAALLDSLFPLMNYYEAPPYERYKSDACVALALTHHLVLSQGVALDLVFELFSRYSRRYVFVEFMPLGLHDGNTAPPLPQWYTIEWFRNVFVKYFNLIVEEQLDENRILFFGEQNNVSDNEMQSHT